MCSWYAPKKEEEIKKTLADEVHEFLTKVYNIYFIKLPPSLYKQFDMVRDKLIPLTVRVDQDRYTEFCRTFSSVYRLVIVDKSIPEDVKNLVRELAEKTNEFFMSRGFPRCVEELKYFNVRVRVRFRGKPLEKATVLAEIEGKIAASKETNEDGIAVLEVPGGKYTIAVYKHLEEDQYIYDEKSVEVDQDISVEFDIEETKTRAEVVRERGERPMIREVK